MIRRLPAACIALTAFAGHVHALDPPLPPGRTLIGIPVAVLGAGVDYTQGGIADHLTRDGEGEVVGFDFVDDDRLPFAKDAVAQENAEIVVREGQSTSLIPVRFDATSVPSFVKCLNYAGASPAKIILMGGPLEGPKGYGLIAAAARHFRDRLFVIPVGNGRHNLSHELPPIVRQTPNLLIVAGSDGNGDIPENSDVGATAVDLATDGRILDNPVAGTGPTNAPVTSTRAAARIAALAARILAVEPFIAGAALKARITGLAKPTTGTSLLTRAGFLERPTRHFWLE